MTVATDHARALSLRRAAVRATLAPSVHNTQPWRFALTSDTLEIHADLERRLPVLDPAGRQLILSCGCALFNARVSLAADGYLPFIHRRPDPAHPSLVARLQLDDQPAPVRDGASTISAPLGALDALVELRRTNRHAFAPDQVPSELLDALERAATLEGASVRAIRDPDERIRAALLAEGANERKDADPAYCAEVRAWSTGSPDRDDGLPGSKRSERSPEEHAGTSCTRGGVLSVESPTSTTPCIVVLGTTLDTADGWIRAGEALERVLLEITRHGFSASPLAQPIETPTIRAELRRQLRLSMHPHLLLRVGRGATSAAPRRRLLASMLREHG